MQDFVRGTYETTLTPGEIVVGFDVPRPPAPLRWGFAKVARKSGAFADSIAFVVAPGPDGPVSVVLAAAGPRPFALAAAAEHLRGAGSEDALRAAIAADLAAHVPGARFLYVCAGSGAVGLEAISRGADEAVFVEQSRRALEQLEENIAHCGVEEQARIVPKDALSALKAQAAAEERFDLVYVDPPYDAGLYRPVLRMLGTGELVAPDGIVVVELRTRDSLPDEAGRLRHYRDVRYGDTTLAFYEPG